MANTKVKGDVHNDTFSSALRGDGKSLIATIVHFRWWYRPNRATTMADLMRRH